ncbi:hypothetical protein [Halorubrum sp. CBA1125]|uniref:hypothetical protein n=1 Tax=Halorubrum sp. CBA1125 TaxID=2668072 RepID=UPI001E50FBD7|nr:hypothetical protein [Halorubrum sp. CBA1125]
MCRWYRERTASSSGVGRLERRLPVVRDRGVRERRDPAERLDRGRGVDEVEERAADDRVVRSGTPVLVRYLGRVFEGVGDAERDGDVVQTDGWRINSPRHLPVVRAPPVRVGREPSPARDQRVRAGVDGHPPAAVEDVPLVEPLDHRRRAGADLQDPRRRRERRREAREHVAVERPVVERPLRVEVGDVVAPHHRPSVAASDSRKSTATSAVSVHVGHAA